MTEATGRAGSEGVGVHGAERGKAEDTPWLFHETGRERDVWGKADATVGFSTKCPRRWGCEVQFAEEPD
jgi:hypothetical protein